VSSRIALSLGLVGLFAAPGPAQEVSESQFVSGVGPDHPAAAATLDALGAAESAVGRARQLTNPRVEYAREQPGEASAQDTVSVSWTPPLGGRRGLAIAAARASLRSVEAGRAAELARIRMAVRGAFAAWSSAAERLVVADDLLRLASDLARRTRLKAEAGEESGLAAGRIDLARAGAAAEQADAAATLARTEAMARAWRPDLPSDARPAPLTLGPTLESLEDGGPAFAALKQAVESAHLQERLAGRFWTTPELQAGWQRQDQAGATESGPVFGVNWIVPLFDRGAPERREAVRRREAAVARLTLAESRRTAAVAGAGEAFHRLSAGAEEAQHAARRAPAVVDSALAAFHAGEATVTDVLDALRSAHDARRREIDARVAAAAAARELEAAYAGLGMGETR